MSAENEYDRNEYDRVVDLLLEAFPTTPPSTVVDKCWGDYADAILAFAEANSEWNPDFVYQHRAILGFVNSSAFLFLLPRFFRASQVNGEIVFDVLEYVIREVEYRLRVNQIQFSRPQTSALLDMLRYWRMQLRDANALDLLNGINSIERQLLYSGPANS